MTTPETAKCACGHPVEFHQLIVSTKGRHRGPCQIARCKCRGPR